MSVTTIYTIRALYLQWLWKRNTWNEPTTTGKAWGIIKERGLGERGDILLNLHFFCFAQAVTVWIPFDYRNLDALIAIIDVMQSVRKTWACPGFEPGTSRTRSENHTPRPTGRCLVVNRFSTVSNAYRHFRFVQVVRRPSSLVIGFYSAYLPTLTRRLSFGSERFNARFWCVSDLFTTASVSLVWH